MVAQVRLIFLNILKSHWGALTNSYALPGHTKLNLTPEEKRVYGQLFRAADPDGFGAVSGDVAVTFFDRTKLSSEVLGQVCAAFNCYDEVTKAKYIQIWQLADTENRGLLTPSGFSVVLRLIGHAQAGKVPTADLASQREQFLYLRSFFLLILY